MIDLTINKQGLEHNLKKAKENGIVIPTIAQMQHPETIPEKIQSKLKNVGLWDVDPLNLFRITWKNEPKESGGLYQAVPNYIELPSELHRTIRLRRLQAPCGRHFGGEAPSRRASLPLRAVRQR